VYESSGDDTVITSSVFWEGCGDDLCREEIQFDPERPDSHINIVSSSKNKIFNFLFNESANTITFEPTEQEISNYFSATMASPADILVTLPDGTLITKDTPEEWWIENGAFYISQGDDGKKVIVIPNIDEGEVQVDVVGNGEGEYTVSTAFVTESTEDVGIYEGNTYEGKEEKFTFLADTNPETEVELVKVNTPPTAILGQEIYEGVDGDEIIFDGSSSSDKDVDTLQYKWLIKDKEEKEIYSTEYLEESILSYTFDDPFEGSITLTVTDGEFEDSVSANISVRAMTYGEKIAEILGSLENLEEDTSYIQSKKRLWIRLVDILELPQVENNGRLKEIIIRILKDDIERSLIIDSRFENTWMWWRRRDLVTDSNEEILRNVLIKIKLL
jgi:hypothetical protein